MKAWTTTHLLTIEVTESTSGRPGAPVSPFYEVFARTIDAKGRERMGTGEGRDLNDATSDALADLFIDSDWGC